MTDSLLRLDPALGHESGPVPADLAEGLSTDGTPLVLQHDQVLASLPPPPPAPGPAFDWGNALASLHSALTDAVPLLQWLILLYFITYYGSYLFLNLMSLFSLMRYRREQGAALPAADDARYELPISLIVPAYNQASTVVAAVRAMQRLEYSKFEIIIVNDGSDDDTLGVLLREFCFAPFPEAYRDRMQTRPVKAVYASTKYPNLRLLDKESGGKADALNAAINCARYPLFCAVDVDFVLQRGSLRKMGRAFAGNEAAVAAGSVVRSANGCATSDGFLGKVELPRNMLALFQIVDQLRTIHAGQASRSNMNAMLILHGAFTLFRKEAVVAAGAYRTDVADQEMELMVRLHRRLRQGNEPYLIIMPEPVCWKVMPENMRALKNRYIRRCRALAESLAMNHKMLFNFRGGAAGGMALAFMLLLEWLGPLLEVLGYVVMTVLWLSGAISLEAFGTFMLVAIVLGMLLSASGLVLEEISSRYYPSLGNVLKLFAVALLENLGYRQLAAIWHLHGLRRSVTSSKV